MKIFKDFGFHGEKALREVLTTSPYGTLEQTVASLALFTHPETVAQTTSGGLFRVRRYKAGEKRGQVLPEEKVVLCDNTTPANVFRWANAVRRGALTEVQFNHIYPKSQSWECYTSLANICVTPAFLSKATDKSPEVRAILRYRVFRLYGFRPSDEPEPTKPPDYDSLSWAPCLPESKDVGADLRAALNSSPKSRAAVSARLFGWHFST